MSSLHTYIARIMNTWFTRIKNNKRLKKNFRFKVFVKCKATKALYLIKHKVREIIALHNLYVQIFNFHNYMIKNPQTKLYHTFWYLTLHVFIILCIKFYVYIYLFFSHVYLLFSQIFVILQSQILVHRIGSWFDPQRRFF